MKKLVGILTGVTTALLWSFYNVGSKLGQIDGFRAIDLILVRYVIGSMILLPAMIWAKERVSIGISRLLVLFLLSGPIFAVLIAQGFQLAPLSHGIVLAPSMSIMSTNLIVFLVERVRPRRHQVYGGAIIICALVLIGVDTAEGQVGGNTWRTTLLGDFCFLTASMM